MTPGFKLCIASYSLATLITVALMVRERESIVRIKLEYLRFLASRWKQVAFALAAASMTLVAPCTGDPTSDQVDAASWGPAGRTRAMNPDFQQISGLRSRLCSWSSQ